MRLNKLFTSTLVLAGMASFAQAQQLNFNEIQIDHQGTDDYEFIELIGTPNMSLDTYVVITIDGEGAASGKIDRVWDLTGSTVPADGYFVMGNIATVPNTDFDLANGPHTTGGANNNVENGTSTFYLLKVPNALDRADLAGPLFDSDIDPDDDLITAIGLTPASFEIIENVGVLEEPLQFGIDDVYDCAPALGPNGNFLPGGIFRPGDYPNEWCGDIWLDWSTPTGPDKTPGTANITATCSITMPSAAGCGTTGGPMTTPYCDPMDNNSTEIGRAHV